jgi:glycosyltransferase involved in cell wall biosynthesis
MRKKRILFCGEATYLNTGYATYGREVLRRLYDTEKYDLAEFASYGTLKDASTYGIPWAFYPNMPDQSNKAQVDQYNSVPTNQFGEWRFEEVLLNFKPDIVFDIRDFWMLDYQQRSPFRKMFTWAIMPTVDAEPQNEQWIATFADANAVFNYSDWGYEVLKTESNGAINCLGSAPPSADAAYQPVEDKKQHKNSLGFESDTKIIGTIMRNQRRKLFPDLFESFRKFLDITKKQNVFLYCHTSYPDIGWDIPKLLNKHGLSSKVLFTYVCHDCEHAFPSFFADAKTKCSRCGSGNAGLSSVRNGVSCEFLSTIMNTFDLYIQYANSEGFGLPQVEAAACGVPIMSVDYSAMSSVVRKLEGIPLKPKALYAELETGCNRAVPDNDLTAK